MKISILNEYEEVIEQYPTFVVSRSRFDKSRLGIFLIGDIPKKHKKPIYVNADDWHNVSKLIHKISFSGNFPYAVLLNSGKTTLRSVSLASLLFSFDNITYTMFHKNRNPCDLQRSNMNFEMIQTVIAKRTPKRPLIKKMRVEAQKATDTAISKLNSVINKDTKENDVLQTKPQQKTSIKESVLDRECKIDCLYLFDPDVYAWLKLYKWYVPITNNKIFTFMSSGAKITLHDYVSLFYRTNADIIGFKDGNSFNLRYNNLIFKLVQTPFHRLIKKMSRETIERKTSMKYTFTAPYTLTVEYFDPLTHCKFEKVFILNSLTDNKRAELFLLQKLIQIRTLRMMHHTA